MQTNIKSKIGKNVTKTQKMFKKVKNGQKRNKYNKTWCLDITWSTCFLIISLKELAEL